MFRAWLKYAIKASLGPVNWIFTAFVLFSKITSTTSLMPFISMHPYDINSLAPFSFLNTWLKLLFSNFLIKVYKSFEFCNTSCFFMLSSAVRICLYSSIVIAYSGTITTEKHSGTLKMKTSSITRNAQSILYGQPSSSLALFYVESGSFTSLVSPLFICAISLMFTAA